jgi:hypothetical protein
VTKGKKFKQRVRARVAQTGESYSRAREVEGGSKGLTFWYYHSTEYPEEGSVFPFASRLEAEKHAGEDKDEMTFAEREATEEELILIDFGRDFRSSRKTALVHQELHDQLVWEARRMAHALRSEAGWEETWPLPWEARDNAEGGNTGSSYGTSTNKDPLTPVQEYEHRKSEANQHWLRDNPGLKEVHLVLTHNEHGTPTVQVRGADLETMQVVPPPDAYVEAIRRAYADTQWYREKGPRDDLGPLPKCSTKIIVNGRPHETDADELSYEDVLRLAYPGIDTARNLSVTVSYRNDRGKILTPGHSVRVEPKMVVSAYDTSNA